MTELKNISHQLNGFLHKIRYKLLLESSTKIISAFFRYFPLYLVITFISENIFYLPNDFREIIWISYWLVPLLFILFWIFKATNIYFGFTRKYSSEKVARHFIAIDEELGNRFLDNLQLVHELKHKEHTFSDELVLESARRTIEQIKSIRLKPLLNLKFFKKAGVTTSLVLMFSAFLFFMNYTTMNESYNRIKNFSRNFPVPLPFQIASLTENQNVFGGDTVEIKIQAEGNFPNELHLDITYADFVSEKYISLDSNGIGNFVVNSVTKDFSFEAYLENRSIFKPWKKITSGIHWIKVKDRPEIINIHTNIKFPEYTKIGEQLKESNSSEFYVMPGSEISIEAELNKPVAQAVLAFNNNNNVNMKLSQNHIFADFKVTEPVSYRFQLTDANGIENINPITYKIKITVDQYPVISLLTPKEDFQLSENMEIPIYARISDDFGFSKALIHYKLLKKFGENKNNEREVALPLPEKEITIQDISHLWDINDLNLAPEDGVEFMIKIFDNDVVNGPKFSTSKKITAFFPSLNDLFSNMQKEQEEVESAGEEILSKLNSSKEVLKDISNKLIKEPKLTWEQKEQLQQEINKTKQADEEIKKLADQLQELQEQSEKNKLFSDETLKKYAELQESFQELMTPELSRAMKDLQHAIDKMDNKNIQKALNKFQTSHDDFSKELDRMLKLMKRVKIEQAVDELVKRIDNLTKRQDSVTQNIDKKSLQENKDWNALQKEEKSIENDTRIFEDRLKRTAEDMEEFPLMNQKALENIQEYMQESELYEDMEQSQKSMQMRDADQSKQNSQNAHQKLSEMKEQMENFQQQFQESNMAEVEQDFQRIISKSLQLSQKQEALNQKMQSLSRFSDQISELAKEQNSNQQNLSKVVQEMSDLSRKTFGISSESTKNIGQAANEMAKAIASMEQRGTSTAARHGKKAGRALNRFAMNMMNSLSELQQSGESTGLQNYMKQMEEMAKQQQGLNNDTQKMGKGMPKPTPGGSRQQYLQQLAARQRQIQNSLQQLQQEMEKQSKNQAGTLKGIAKDMEDVVKELENNQVLRKTIQRQQQILTRMLDAQKSLRTQSYKKERESKTAQDITRIPPGELPADLGERNLILRQKLEEAMKNGYSTEYQEIIRKYFEKLAKEESENEK